MNRLAVAESQAAVTISPKTFAEPQNAAALNATPEWARADR